MMKIVVQQIHVLCIHQNVYRPPRLLVAQVLKWIQVLVPQVVSKQLKFLLTNRYAFLKKNFNS